MNILTLAWSMLYVINQIRPLSPFHEDGYVYHAIHVVICFTYMSSINLNKLLPYSSCLHSGLLEL